MPTLIYSTPPLGVRPYHANSNEHFVRWAPHTSTSPRIYAHVMPTSTTRGAVRQERESARRPPMVMMQWADAVGKQPVASHAGTFTRAFGLMTSDKGSRDVGRSAASLKPVARGLRQKKRRKREKEDFDSLCCASICFHSFLFACLISKFVTSSK